MSTSRDRLTRRQVVVAASRAQSGLVTTTQLRELGVTRSQLRAEVAAERWTPIGSRIVAVGAADENAAWCAAVLGRAPQSAGGAHPRAALGGLTALFAAGLSGIDGDGLIHVAAPKSSRPLAAPAGVRVHETRRWRDEDVIASSPPRVRTPAAAVQAALWARTSREAALLLCAPVQQRLTTAADLGESLDLVRRDPRRALLRSLVDELADGVHSLNELDFARMCRARGLPEPERQVVVQRAGGNAHLDVRWRRWGVVVEIDGIGHLRPDRWIEDSVRHNEIALGGDVVLHVTSIGLRLQPDRNLALVERALRQAGWSPPL